MAKKIQKVYMLLGITVLIMTTLACGSVQVGVVTPTHDILPVNENQEPESELASLEEAESQTEDELASEPTE
jgi:hypothetical protein